MTDPDQVTLAAQADKESNWLPAPPGVFRPVLRCYLPGPAILAGHYELPPVRKVS